VSRSEIGFPSPPTEHKPYTKTPSALRQHRALVQLNAFGLNLVDREERLDNKTPPTALGYTFYRPSAPVARHCSIQTGGGLTRFDQEARLLSNYQTPGRGSASRRSTSMAHRSGFAVVINKAGATQQCGPSRSPAPSPPAAKPCRHGPTNHKAVQSRRTRGQVNECRPPG